VIALTPPAFIFPVIERWRRLPGNLRGGIWMLLGGLEMSTAMAIAKDLTDEIHAFELNFFRCLFGLMAMVPLLFGGGVAIMRTKRLGLHLGRGILGGIGQICVFYALAHLSLAVVIAITFTRPLFLVVLAVLFLGELVRWRRWSAIVVGFLGVLIVARPVVDQVTVALFVLVFSTACHASAHVFLKKASGVDRPATVVFYYLVISTLVGAVPTALVWTTPTAAQFLWLALTGILYLMGQGMIALAFRAGEATAIMPFDYSRLLYGILFDIVLFSQFPDGWTITGSCVIITSTLYVARRQAQVGRVRPDEGEPLA
jgi:drug/metabolite transporter (DMT)-like permease